MKLFKTVPAYFIAIYLFLQLLRFEFNSIIKPIEKFQDDILYSFSILQSSGLNGIKYEHKIYPPKSKGFFKRKKCVISWTENEIYSVSGI